MKIAWILNKTEKKEMAFGLWEAEKASKDSHKVWKEQGKGKVKLCRVPPQDEDRVCFAVFGIRTNQHQSGISY